MGSFNTSCGLSNLQIVNGDRIVGFFLTQNTRYRSGAHSTYSCDHFSISSLPLVGEYADYGRIELTKKQSVLSKAILNKDCNLEEFQEDKWRKDDGGFVFFHEDIYHKAIQTFGGKRPSLDEINEFIQSKRNEFDRSKTQFLADMNLTQELMNSERFNSLGYFFENMGGHDSIHSSLKREFKQHILQHLDSSKHLEVKEFKDIPHIEEIINSLFEMRDLSYAMENLHKLFMPQFTSGQDTMALEEAKWNTYLMTFSNQRVQQFYDADWLSEEEVEEFKENQRPLLEAQILNFGTVNPIESSKKTRKM